MVRAILVFLVLVGGIFGTARAESGALVSVGQMDVHVAVHDDTLADIGRRYGIGYVALRAANPEVDPWLPGEGTEIILPSMRLLPDAPQEGIVINLPEMRLYAYITPDAPPLSYPIGIGREGLKTPTGSTRIVDKRENPEWRPTARMRREDPTLPVVVPPGPDNPLGAHALYLGWPEYRIHGTNKPYGIGRRVSSGCIRMFPESVADLYPRVSIGMPVSVVNQPVKAAWIGDSLYVEAHPTMEQADQMEEEGDVSGPRMSEEDMRVILDAAGAHTNRLDWAAIRQIVRERRGYPLIVATRENSSEI